MTRFHMTDETDMEVSCSLNKKRGTATGGGPPACSLVGGKTPYLY